MKGQWMAAVLTDEMRRFLDEPRFAVLATVNPDGSPQQTVMWYRLDGDEILMNTRRGRKKDRNLARDARVSLCVADGYTYLTLTGSLEVDENPESGQSGIHQLAVRYHGPEKAAEMVASQFSREERVNLRLCITAVDAHGFGDAE
jgi:PPOX class probable F420-dependent enzyme